MEKVRQYHHRWHWNVSILKLLNSMERIQPWIMCTTFNGNPCTTIVSCYSLTNASDEMNPITFCSGLFSLDPHFPNHNFLFISRDRNAQIAKIKVLNFTYTTIQIKMAIMRQMLHSLNIFAYLNNKFQKIRDSYEITLTLNRS